MRRPTLINIVGRIAPALLCCLILGCGTTKWSDSPRTATEQLLISDAIDRAVSEIDFSALANKNVYLETRYITGLVDQNYLVSTFRQHMLASGCIVKDRPEEANFVVEVRAGSLGTNRQDLLFGMPATTIPTGGLLPTGPASIPEIAFMKRTNQQGVCKVAVFAYDRYSGRPVWQSGTRQVASRAKDIWLLGAGPFQRGTVYKGTAFAGERLKVPLVNNEANPSRKSTVSVVDEVVFADPASQGPTVTDGPRYARIAQPAGGGPTVHSTAPYAQATYTAVVPAENPPAASAGFGAGPIPPAGSAPDSSVPPGTNPSSGYPTAPAPGQTTPYAPGQGQPSSAPAVMSQGSVTAPPPNPAETTAGMWEVSNLAKGFLQRK